MKRIFFYTFCLLLLYKDNILAVSIDTNSSLEQYLDIEASLRYYSMARTYDEFLEDPANPYTKKRASNAIGGSLGIHTKDWNYWSVGATLYTSQPVFHNPQDEGGLQLLQDDQSGFSVLGEAYIEYQDRYNLLKIGRQKLSAYRFLADNDCRMVPYTYEAASIENRKLDNIIVRAAVVTGVKTHASTEYIDFVNASKDLLKEQTINRNPIRGNYNPNNFDANGNYIGPRENLYLISGVYSDKKFIVELWDYIVPDFVNFVYTTATYKFDYNKFHNSFSLQYVQQNDVGNHIAGNINTYAYGIEFHSNYENLHFTYSFNKVKYDENSLDGGSIIDTWGNDLLYCGLFYNGADQAGTVANSIIMTYDFQSYPFKIFASAGIFDLPNNMNDLFADQDNNEYDFVIHYLPKWNKKLTFKFETVYVDFDTDYNFKGYEALHGYTFLHTYDTIVDMRFIVNYTF